MNLLMVLCGKHANKQTKTNTTTFKKLLFQIFFLPSIAQNILQVLWSGMLTQGT